MSQALLFPDLHSPAEPVRTKNGVEYFDLPAKSLLNSCNSCQLPNAVTVNPYRGCEFGCSYCYARYTHEFMELGWEDFEKKIFIKTAAPQVLLKTLDCGKLRGKHIAIGTATDPYQPAEARHLITRRLLEVFAQVKGLNISLTTKSALFTRDLDLFEKIAAQNRFRINVSLITLNATLVKSLEPKASTARARLASLKTVSSAGIETAVFLMPILPGLTDGSRTLESVVRAARENGASDLRARVLFLRESARRVFFDYLARNQPRVFRRYQELYRRSYTEDNYQDRILSVVRELKKRYGFDDRPSLFSEVEEAFGLYDNNRGLFDTTLLPVETDQSMTQARC